ncbi:MAG: nitrate/nitrite transporter NrtS [Micropepsaceae bacterium]
MTVDWTALKRATSPPTLQGSLRIALVVGTILNIINQSDAILAHAHLNWVRCLLTYLVPFAVATYSAYRAYRAFPKN